MSHSIQFLGAMKPHGNRVTHHIVLKPDSTNTSEAVHPLGYEEAGVHGVRQGCVKKDANEVAARLDGDHLRDNQTMLGG